MFHKLESFFLTKSIRNKLIKLLKNADSKLHITELFKRNLLIAILVNIVIIIFLVYRFTIFREGSIISTIIVVISSWLVLFFIVFAAVMISTFFMLQMRIYKRRAIVEDVFADFLQITATNIRAGMSIDRALWSSIRPRFGDLAKEMETVAKKTMSGTELAAALSQFAEKYKSPLLKRSISLLVQGAESGGEIADLLSHISWNIQETKLMKKEMRANVTSYLIFITATSVFIAPFLFALSSQLITIMSQVGSNIDLGSVGSSMANMPISFSAEGISIKDFKIFAYLCLGITAFFSAMIISIISKGTVKLGLKLIPLFMLISFLLFTGFSYLLKMVFSSFF